MSRLFSLLMLVAVSPIFLAAQGQCGELVVDPDLDQLVSGQSGTIKFQSYDASAEWHWYDIYTRLYQTHPSVVSGSLSFPKDHTGKIPAIVIMHDSDGLQAVHEYAWAKFFNGLGYATFVVDSFSGRNVKSTRRDGEAVTEESMVIDAFQALKMLASDPDIDSNRIAITGYSKGAVVTYFTAWKFYQRRLSSKGLKFAAHLALYSWCNMQEEEPSLTGAPMLFLSGEKDTITPAKPCSRFVDRAKAANVDASIIIYPKARHSFDDPSSPPGGDAKGWNSSECRWAVNFENDQGFKPDYQGPWLDWPNFAEFWKSCFKRGDTWGYNKKIADQAHRDAKAFLDRVLPVKN